MVTALSLSRNRRGRRWLGFGELAVSTHHYILGFVCESRTLRSTICGRKSGLDTRTPENKSLRPLSALARMVSQGLILLSSLDD